MDSVAERMGVQRPEDWSKVSLSDVRKLKGGGLLERYKGSMARALQDIYPELAADASVWRPAAPKNHWADKATRRAALDRVAAAKGVTDPRDWKNVSKKDVLEHCGGGLLARYGGSIYHALLDTYDELKTFTAPQLRAKVPQRFWESADNRRKFLDGVAAELHLTSPADWAGVSYVQLRGMGAASLLDRYSGSVFAMLEDVYGARSFCDAALSRSRVTNGYWDDVSNIKAFLKKAGGHLGVKDTQDWLRVSHAQLSAVGGGTLLNRMPLSAVLELAFPDYDWRSLKDDRPKKSTQMQLRRSVEYILGCA